MPTLPVAPLRRARRARRGFTLIELLVAVVVIGILAAAAAPAFANTRGKANLAKVKSDLRNLAQAQEQYFYDHSRYAEDKALLGLNESEGVRMQVVEGGTNGWSARAVHPSATPVTCAVFYGNAAPVAPATEAGKVACQ